MFLVSVLVSVFWAAVAICVSFLLVWFRFFTALIHWCIRLRTLRMNVRTITYKYRCIKYNKHTTNYDMLHFNYRYIVFIHRSLPTRSLCSLPHSAARGSHDQKIMYSSKYDVEYIYRHSIIYHKTSYLYSQSRSPAFMNNMIVPLQH